MIKKKAKIETKKNKPNMIEIRKAAEKIRWLLKCYDDQNIPKIKE